MDGKDAVFWREVPDTNMVLMASNTGRLMRLVRRKRFGRSMIPVGVFEDVRLVCDYKTARFGWWAYFDGVKHFILRDEIERLFPEGMRSFDKSRDEELRRKREETFVEDLSEKGHGRKAQGDAG